MTTVAGRDDTALEPLVRLPAVGLEELVERSALQTRIDRKYVVDPSVAAELLASAPPGTRALDIDGERTFGYTSVYLDTPELVGYHLAAHRRRRRFKVRSRSYDGSGLAYLEVKTRDGAHTVKARLEGQHVRGDGLTAEGRAFVADTLADAGIAPALVGLLTPALRTRYRRSTLQLAGDACRVTLDRDLHWWACATGAARSSPELVVVETKSAGAVSPMDRRLWARGVRPTRISKYATGLAALHPDLPHNRWSRTLRRHF
jgi:hypothetical protein